MYRIAFFSIYAYGHTNPTLPVVRELTSRGHVVRYYSFSPFRAGIEAAGAEFVSCDRYMPPPPKDLDRRIGRDFASLVEMVTQVTLNLHSFLGPDLAAFRPDCIVSDSLCFWGKLWAHRLVVPYLCSTTTFAFDRQTARLMRQSPSQLLRLLAGRRRISQCMDRLRAHGYPVSGLLSLIQNDNETDTIVYTSRQFQPMSECFSDRYAFIGPSLPEVSHAPRMPGRQHLYISLGTVNNRALPFYHACLEAFRDVPLEVVLSTGSQEAAAQLGTPPSHITILPKVDQLEVLSHTDVFLTHCGMNSVSEGLYLGVPLVLFPQQEEQRLVARRAAQLGAGVFLRHPRPEAIRQAVFQVLTHPEYQAHAEAVSQGFRAAGGFRRGADKVLSVAAR